MAKKKIKKPKQKNVSKLAQERQQERQNKVTIDNLSLKALSQSVLLAIAHEITCNNPECENVTALRLAEELVRRVKALNAGDLPTALGNNDFREALAAMHVLAEKDTVET